MTVSLILVGLVAGSVAVLAMPITLVLDVDNERVPVVNAKVVALLGLVRTSVQGGSKDNDGSDDGEEAPSETAEKAENTAKKRKKNKQKAGLVKQLKRALAIYRHGGLGELHAFVKRLWAALGVRDLRVRVAVGADDPAETGQLYGMMLPVILWAKTTPHDIEVRPVFDQELLTVRGGGRFRVVPLQVVAVLVGVLVRPRLWRAAWAAARVR